MAEKSLFQPMRPNDEADVIAATFGVKPTLDELPAFKDFISYYKAELQRLNYAVSLHNAQRHSFVVRDHTEVASVVRVLSEYGGSHISAQSSYFYRLDMRRKIVEELKNSSVDRNASQEDLNRCIDLGIRILTMINVREQCFALQMPKTPSFEWDDYSSLPQFIEDLFKCPIKELPGHDRWLQSSFTVANMDSICGLRVEWTQSLEDHLRLDRSVKTLRVFPYRGFLARRLECDRKSLRLQSTRFYFPRLLIEETLRTLDLLFPFGDSKTTKYLKESMQQQIHGEGPFSNRRTLDLAEFNFWRERLLELHREVFQSPPQSWFQLLIDRRNPQQWLTLWIAFVVFLLTMISTAASIVQAWAAIQALRK